jgi:quercetin dioxygenase-like cupin family protein
LNRWLKLPLSFPVTELQRDLDSIEPTAWIDHFNTAAHERPWRCVPLRSVEGRTDHVMPTASTDYRDTSILSGRSGFQQVLDHFECEITSVRLMSLGPGAVIKPHRDRGASLEDGIARLHIPIRTAPEVLFTVDGEAVHFSAGHTWYLNAARLHSVVNASPGDRVHLTLDCIPNAWLERLFEAAGWVRRPAPTYGDPSIHDGNVWQVIDALRRGGHAAGAAEARRLQGIAEGRA